MTQFKLERQLYLAYVNSFIDDLKEMYLGSNPATNVVHEVFLDANNFTKSGTLMLGVIEKLEEAIDYDDIKARG